MFFGTRVPYAAFHQTGTRRMPARKPVELSERNRRKVVKIIQAVIMDRAE
jgi:phage gpG-like protein